MSVKINKDDALAWAVRELIVDISNISGVEWDNETFIKYITDTTILDEETFNEIMNLD